VSDETGALHRGQVRLIASGFPSMVIVVVAIAFAGNSAAHSALWRCDPRARLSGHVFDVLFRGHSFPTTWEAQCCRALVWPYGLYLGRV
jgi:hypothetical protein